MLSKLFNGREVRPEQLLFDLAVISLFVFSTSVQAQCTNHLSLSSHERNQFIDGFYGRRTEVYGQFLSAPGCEKVMMDALRSFGGNIRYADEKVGYALVLLPRMKFLEVLDLPGIEYAFPSGDGHAQAMGLSDEPSAGMDGSLSPVSQVSIPDSRVATELSKDGPYFAAHEIGLDSLWRQHPEADGRGVVAAVLDDGLDLFHPALRQARDPNGELVPKIIDLTTLTTPEEDTNWVQLGEPFKTQDSTFQAVGRTWTTPEDGVYRFGIFRRELILGPPMISKTRKLPLIVGVLLEEKSNRVWVDTNGDGSFADQRPLSDFGITHDIDWFGKQEGKDDNRIPFGVKIDSDKHAVYLTIADGIGHGAAIAGSLAANRLTGGLYDGAAPSVQLVDARNDSPTELLALLSVAARKDVGVINRSGSIAKERTADYWEEGTKDFEQHLVDRIVEVYDKPMACVCQAAGTIGVDDYVSGEMLRRNRQTSGPYVEAVHAYYDADRNFGLVNNVVAPSAQLNTESRYIPLGIEFVDGKRHYVRDDQLDSPAPMGYMIGANESPTIPVVSGVLADLISEAKLEHVRYSATRLNQAVFASARILPGIPLYEQGYGLIQADRAWDQLAKMAKSDDPANATLTSFKFSQVQDDHRKAIDGYYSEVTAPGGTVDGEVWVTRYGGYAGGRPYGFALRGDDGTYTLLTAKATLVQDEPVKLRFAAKATPGFHVSFLELVDQKTGAVMQQVPLSLKVPDTPQSVGVGVDQYTVTMAPRRNGDRLINLGDDVQAARYEAQIPYGGDVVWMPGFQAPFSLHNGVIEVPLGEPIDATHHVGPMRSFESLAVNKHDGIQDLLFENRGLHAEYETPYDPPAPSTTITATVTVTKYGITFGKNSNHEVTVTNRLAAIEGKVEFYDASLKSAQLTGTGSHAFGELEFTLPAKLVQWRLNVAASSTLDGPADAFVLDCTGGDMCHAVAQQEISASANTIAIDKPPAGDWRIVVRSRDRVSRLATYQVQQALLVPFRTPTEEKESKHASGATWTLPLPQPQSDAQYVAFRIAGTPGNKREENGLRIGLTSLDGSAP
jgi:hypothetical protein